MNLQRSLTVSVLVPLPPSAGIDRGSRDSQRRNISQDDFARKAQDRTFTQTVPADAAGHGGSSASRDQPGDPEQDSCCALGVHARDGFSRVGTRRTPFVGVMFTEIGLEDQQLDCQHDDRAAGHDAAQRPELRNSSIRSPLFSCVSGRVGQSTRSPKVRAIAALYPTYPSKPMPSGLRTA